MRKRLGDVAVPGLGHDAGDRCAGVDEVGQDGVVLGADPGATGRAERHQGGGREGELLARPGEELNVLGIGPGPSTLNEGDAQMVQLLGHPELVGHREGQPLLLAPVAQDGVENVDGLGEFRYLVVVGQIRVGVRRTAAVGVRHATGVGMRHATGARTGVWAPACSCSAQST